MIQSTNLGEYCIPPRCKKLPPYGRHLIDLIKSQKINNDLFVLIGEGGWDYAKWHKAIGHAVLVLPNGDFPQEYRWDAVKNLDVLVVVTSPVPFQLVRSLAYELLRAGAFIVRAVSLTGSLVIFRQEERRK